LEYIQPKSTTTVHVTPKIIIEQKGVPLEFLSSKVASAVTGYVLNYAVKVDGYGSDLTLIYETSPGYGVVLGGVPYQPGLYTGKLQYQQPPYALKVLEGGATVAYKQATLKPAAIPAINGIRVDEDSKIYLSTRTVTFTLHSAYKNQAIASPVVEIAGEGVREKLPLEGSPWHTQYTFPSDGSYTITFKCSTPSGPQTLSVIQFSTTPPNILDLLTQFFKQLIEALQNLFSFNPVFG
jgi:hypothetical protein